MLPEQKLASLPHVQARENELLQKEACNLKAFNNGIRSHKYVCHFAICPDSGGNSGSVEHETVDNDPVPSMNVNQPSDQSTMYMSPPGG